MSDMDVEMQVYIAARWRAVTWRMHLNKILNGKVIIEDLAILYATATRHYEAFEVALEARRMAYAGRAEC